MTALVLQGNALNLPLPDESVDLIVTSPPYFALRSYQDEGAHYTGQLGSEPTPKDFLDALVAATAEMVRVLKPSGSIFVNLGDKYAGSGGHNNSNITEHKRGPSRYNQNTTTPAKSLELIPHRYAIRCVDELGLICRQDQVWSKPNGLPESVTDRTRRSHEYWFHFTKSPRYFSAIDEIREPHTGTTTPQAPRTMHSGNGLTHRVGGTDGASLNPLGKLPGSVWSIATEPLKIPAHLGIDHFAAFPTEWPRRLILGWSPSGICVECGEGRRPVVDKQVDPNARTRPGTGEGRRVAKRDLARSTAAEDGGYGSEGYLFGNVTATITGYACACPEPTAPTTPSIILDPFGGTGTTALVAKTLGRIGISLDLSHDYSRLAQWRTSKHSVKAMSRTNLERQGGLAL